MFCLGWPLLTFFGGARCGRSVYSVLKPSPLLFIAKKRLLYLYHKYQGVLSQTRKIILYLSFLPTIRPVAHSNESPVPKTPLVFPEQLAKSPENLCTSEFEDEPKVNCLHRITQKKLNNLTSNLNLTISKCESLKSSSTVEHACSWKKRHCIDDDRNSSSIYFKRWGALLLQRFSELISTLNINYDPRK